MNIQQMITFINYAKYKSYTKVAMNLNYAVSTVADHIYNLEKEFGVKLVSKKGKSSELTDSGKILLPYIHSMLREYEEAKNAIEISKGVQGQLKIVAIESIALYDFQELLYKFKKLYPNVDISVTIQDPINFHKLILTEEFDIALKYDFEDSISDMFESIKLFVSPVVLFCNPNHRLAKKKKINKKDLIMQNFIMTQATSPYTNLLNSYLDGYEFNITMFLDSGVLIKKIVQRENVLSLLPEIIIKDDIKNKALCKLNSEDLNYFVTAHAMTLKKDWQRPVIKEFLKFLKSEYDLLNSK